jgi:hypothetical protein
VTHEEVFREQREYCKRRSEGCRRWYERKFFYLFTCEYCFSHYIAAAFLIITRFKLLFPDWRGYVIAFFFAGVDRESVHERLQPPAARYQNREAGRRD